MSNFYYPGILPEEYNQAFLSEELGRIASALSALEVPTILLAPQYSEPTRPQDGMVAHADGTDWNPGHGAGLYEYVGGVWEPLFSLVSGIAVARATVSNTTTETTIYTNTIPANQLSLEEVIKLSVDGYYDTGAASDTWTLRVKLGGVTLHTVVRASANNAIDFGWELVLTGTVRTVGVSGTFIDSAKLADETSLVMSNDETVHTIDTTIANDLVVTIQWGAAKAANVFNLDQGFLEAYH